MVRIAAPIIILAVLIAISLVIFTNPPQARRGGPPPGPQTIVQVQSVESQDFRIKVRSYGTVQPRTRSALVSQVAGQIIEVSPQFRPGGFFAAGDMLVRVDPRDYQANVNIAQASLMDAKQALAQEQARAAQAAEDWQRLAADAEPSALVLRKPQLEAARARVLSAESNLAKARLNLERSAIRAPYAGRILQQFVDLGQVVGGASPVAEVYATDYVEVRLPVRNSDLAYIDLPENVDPSLESLPVVLRSELGDAISWQGRVLRTEGAIDEISRQLHVVAQVDNPFRPEDGSRPLKIGEYLTAEISGKTLIGALVIPAKTVYQGSYVYVVEEGILQRRAVQVGWQDDELAVIRSGLASGEQLVVTPLGQVTSGTPVRVQQSGRPPGTVPLNKRLGVAR
ncbi:MAG: efflux RND transporter periplasmic adaptor subunit [Pseudomonadota bacterium]